MSNTFTNKNSVPIQRWHYGNQFSQFAEHDPAAILGELAVHSTGDIAFDQTSAWLEQIRILRELKFSDEYLPGARIYFEFVVPRLGRRADVVLLVGGVLFILEFKVGDTEFQRAAIDQVWDYALDFKNFHETSHKICVVPILIATGAEAKPFSFGIGHEDGVATPICATPSQLSSIISGVVNRSNSSTIDATNWESGRYLPTPTIVEAARALYSGHAVSEISRSDAGATNLSLTSNAIECIINNARRDRKKAICFVTGVPGAGKTLVGLDVANRHLDAQSETYSVFLSGNGPLVAVLREALARDRVATARKKGGKIPKSKAKQQVEAFIQNVHHFRDEYLRDPGAPPEHVVLFDEAQRAWNLEQTSSFMKKKRGQVGFSKSEPEFLISCLDRQHDWAVVVCLVGGGQEINIGEGGISEWFDAVLRSFGEWEIFLSKRIRDDEYGCSEELIDKVLSRPNTHLDESLHLATSMRSFRAENVSHFIKKVLDLELENARLSLAKLSERYQITITRDLSKAKNWLRQEARGSERYGVIVSSQAERLKPHAINVRVKTDPVKWFLEDKSDTRSSYFLEDVATEFLIQGLELDWACVVWDGDLRINQKGWAYHQFHGSRWKRIHKPDRQRYLLNAYRVLLTRARQGMVLVVPEGDPSDITRSPDFYDPTYRYLKSLGLREI